MKALCLLLALLLAGLIIWMVLHGNPLSVYLPRTADITSAEDVNVSFDTADVVETQFVSLSKHNIRVRLQTVSAGSAAVTVNTPEQSYTFTVHTLPLGLIYDEENGNFSGWQGIVVGNMVFFFCAAFLFLRSYIHARGPAVFSYTTVACFGFGLYALSLALFNASMLITYFLNPRIQSAYDALRLLSDSTTNFVTYTSPVLVLFTAALCIAGAVLFRREGVSKVNLLGIALSLLILVGMAVGYTFYRVTRSHAETCWADCALNAYYGIYSILECMMMAVLVTFLRLRRHEPDYDKDCIVILGCAIRRDGTLYPLIRGRVDRALKFAEKQMAAGGPAPVFIPSGGQGGNEPIPEGKAMEAYLLSKGIPTERILPETESVNTEQNLCFSRKIIGEKVRPDAVTAFSTTGYHTFRSGILAAAQNWPVDGMSSSTGWYFWPNALVREFIGLLYRFRGGLLRLILVTVTLTVLVTLAVG